MDGLMIFMVAYYMMVVQQVAQMEFLHLLQLEWHLLQWFVPIPFVHNHLLGIIETLISKYQVKIIYMA